MKKNSMVKVTNKYQAFIYETSYKAFSLEHSMQRKGDGRIASVEAELMSVGNAV